MFTEVFSLMFLHMYWHLVRRWGDNSGWSHCKKFRKSDDDRHNDSALVLIEDVDDVKVSLFCSARHEACWQFTKF